VEAVEDFDAVDLRSSQCFSSGAPRKGRDKGGLGEKKKRAALGAEVKAYSD
jgi:hypothetical protein